MFEVVLSTIDSKMKRVENLDRAVHSLMHKMESLESKSDRMSEKVDRLLDEVRRKLDDEGGGGRDFDTDEEDMFVAEPSIQVTWIDAVAAEARVNPALSATAVGEFMAKWLRSAGYLSITYLGLPTFRALVDYLRIKLQAKKLWRNTRETKIKIRLGFFT